MFIAIVLFIYGDLTISDYGEAESNKSYLYLVNKQGTGLFSVILSIARLTIGSVKLLSQALLP